jgi:hypothetical protein
MTCSRPASPISPPTRCSISPPGWMRARIGCRFRLISPGSKPIVRNCSRRRRTSFSSRSDARVQRGTSRRRSRRRHITAAAVSESSLPVRARRGHHGGSARLSRHSHRGGDGSGASSMPGSPALGARNDRTRNAAAALESAETRARTGERGVGVRSCRRFCLHCTATDGAFSRADRASWRRDACDAKRCATRD